jgi:hypothetical protein
MKDLDRILSHAQDNVNRALAEYETPSSTLALEFRELKLQACIFQYEICAEMAGLIRNRPVGFAVSVALKGLVHRLYEYDQLLSKHLINRLLALAKARGVPIDRGDLKTLRKQWKFELAKLKQWSDIRNETTGHYSKNIARQVSLLKDISFSEVMGVTQAFLQFNMGILNVMKNAGADNDT